MECRPPGVSESAVGRRKMKERDPEKYAEYLAKQREAAKKRRDKLKREISKKRPKAEFKQKHDKVKAQGRARQERFRERERSMQASSDATKPSTAGHGRTHNQKNNNDKPILKIKMGHFQTRNAVIDRKRYNRMKQQERRERIKEDPVLYEEFKEKDRKRKRKGRMEERKEEEEEQRREEEEAGPSGYNRVKTLQNVTGRAKQTIPSEPRRYAGVVKRLVTSATQLQKAALTDVGVGTMEEVIAPALVDDLNTSKEGKEAKKVIASAAHKHDYSQRLLAKTLKISRKTISRAVRGAGKRIRRNRLDPDITIKIHSLFKREDISRIMPHKRYQLKGKPTYMLQVSLQTAYKRFKEAYPGIKCGYTSFKVRKPKYVRDNAKQEVCLCVYCCNVNYKLETIHRLYRQRKINTSNIPKTEVDFVKHITCECEEESFYLNPQCLHGSCEFCSGQQVERIIRETFQAVDGEEQVSWKRWESGGPGTSRRELKTKSGVMSELVDELIMDTIKPAQNTNFVNHVGSAHWQHKQYRAIKDNLPLNTALMIMDFAKNRELFYQDEIKSAFYGRNQVTMHPIIIYYQTASNEPAKKVSMVFLSDDRTHDHHAVAYYTNQAIDFLKTVMDVEKVIIFSDGCAGQYKGKGNFADIAISETNIERNYFASEHGKGEGDGEIGVINKNIDKAILHRRVTINSVQDLFAYCQEHLSQDNADFKRVFELVLQGEIDHQRPETKVKGVPGSRKIHQIQKVDGSTYKVQHRKLSCFCQYCRNTNEGICSYAEYVGAFMPVDLVLEGTYNTKSSHVGIEANINLQSNE